MGVIVNSVKVLPYQIGIEGGWMREAALGASQSVGRNGHLQKLASKAAVNFNESSKGCPIINECRDMTQGIA